MAITKEQLKEHTKMLQEDCEEQGKDIATLINCKIKAAKTHRQAQKLDRLLAVVYDILRLG